MAKSINQKTVLIALEMCGNRIEDAHHRAAEILNDKLSEASNGSLGDVAPHISRLFPTLVALERQGLIHTIGDGRKRYSLIELVHQPEQSPEVSVPDPSPQEAVIIKALGELGGYVEDPSGQVTVTLRELVGEGIPRQQWRLNLEDAEHHGWIERTIESGRAVRIELTKVAANWYQETYGTVAQEADMPVLEEIDLEEELVPQRSAPSLDDEAFAEQVAFKLLDKVIERAKAPYVEPAEHERITKQTLRLQEQVEKLKEDRRQAEMDKQAAEDLFKVASAENDRMSKQINELQETVADLAAERDEWHKKHAQLEVQLSAVITPSSKKKSLGQELRNLTED